MSETDETMQRIAEGIEVMGRVMGAWLAQVMPPLVEAFGKLASDPAVRAAIEAGYVTPVEDRRDCHCFCAKTHPGDLGVCENDAVTARRFTTELLGPVDVPLCAPCAAAQGIAELASI